MKHVVIPSLISFALICATAVAGCGGVQAKSDGSAGGAGGTANGGSGAGVAGTTGAAGTSGAGGTAGTNGVAGTRGPGGGSDGGGRGGAAGGGAGGAGEKCGMATCAAGQPCCNASCGLCMQPGALCTQKVCSDLRWYYTCGARSICAATDAGTADAGTSLPSCGPDDKLNGACPTLGLMCIREITPAVACSCVRPNLRVCPF